MERVNHFQKDFFTMAPIVFTFNRNFKCAIFPPTKTQRVTPLQRPSKISEVEAVFCPASYTFAISSLNLTGQFQLNFRKNFFISDLEIGQIEVEPLASGIRLFGGYHMALVDPISQAAVIALLKKSSDRILLVMGVLDSSTSI